MGHFGFEWGKPDLGLCSTSRVGRPGQDVGAGRLEGFQAWPVALCEFRQFLDEVNEIWILFISAVRYGPREACPAVVFLGVNLLFIVCFL